jgi:hypothetical protein
MKELKVNENPLWSPSRFGVADRCMKGYWFQYVFHLKHTIPSGVAIGKLEHRMIENFWKKDPSSGLLVPGYKSYESFVNSAVRDWKFYYVKTGESEGQRIEWGQYDGKGYAPWLIGRIAESMGMVYTRYMEEEPRLGAEIRMEGEVEGIKIMAIADELRRGLVIRDHKSGNRRIGEYFVKNNTQMTVCLMCLFNCLQSPFSEVVPKAYPEYVGISLDEFLDIARVEIHDISVKWSKDGMREATTEIHEEKRTEQDFYEVLEFIQSKQRALRERDFSPSKDNCDYCFYKRDCHNYDPNEYHENEYERNFPLFANAEVFMDSSKPKVVSKRRQKSLRFK